MAIWQLLSCLGLLGLAAASVTADASAGKAGAFVRREATAAAEAAAGKRSLLALSTAAGADVQHDLKTQEDAAGKDFVQVEDAAEATAFWAGQSDAAVLAAAAEIVNRSAALSQLAEWHQLQGELSCKVLVKPVLLNEAGRVMDHDLQCPPNRMMTSFHMVETSGSARAFRFTCCQLGSRLGSCQTRRMPFAAEGANFLSSSSHDVQCAPGQGLVHWNLRTMGDTQHLLFKCCDPGQRAKFGTCKDSVTAVSDVATRSELFESLHCEEGWVLAGWKFNGDRADGHLKHTCCPVGRVMSLGRVRRQCGITADRTTTTFGGLAHNIPANGTSQTVWLFRNPYVKVQSLYQGDCVDCPDSKRGVAIAGQFLKGHKLVITKEVRVGTNALPGMYNKVFWDDREILASSGDFKPEGVNVRVNAIRGSEHDAVVAYLPLGVSLKLQLRPESLEGQLSMLRLPGGQGGHCVDEPEDTTVSVLSAVSADTGLDASRMVREDEDFFSSDHHGVEGESAGRMIDDCTGPGRAEAERSCLARFASGEAHAQEFVDMCIYSSCWNTPASLDEVSVDGESEAEEEAALEGSEAAAEEEDVEELESPSAEEGQAAGRRLALGRPSALFEAQESCGDGRELAMPRSSAEHRAVTDSLALIEASVTNMIRLGGGYNATLNRWQWADGTDMCGFENWATGEGDISTDPDKTSVCLNTVDHKWYQCSPDDKFNTLCAEKHSHMLMHFATAVDARSTCGQNRQLAMPKSFAEHTSLLEAVQTEVAGAGSFTWLGARYVGNDWQWEDGTPMCGFTNWEKGQPDLAMAETSALWLCMHTTTGKWHVCPGYEAEHYVVCEAQLLQTEGLASSSTGAELDSERSMWGVCSNGKVSNSLLGFRTTPFRSTTKFDGYCYYFSKPKKSCEETCIEQLGTHGYCSHAGLKRAASSMWACKKIIKGHVVTHGARVQYLDTGNNGCAYIDSKGGKQIVVERKGSWRHKEDPSCLATSMHPHLHRMCACAHRKVVAGTSWVMGKDHLPMPVLGQRIRLVGRLTGVDFEVSLKTKAGLTVKLSGRAKDRFCQWTDVNSDSSSVPVLVAMFPWPTGKSFTMDFHLDDDAVHVYVDGKIYHQLSHKVSTRMEVTSVSASNLGSTQLAVLDSPEGDLGFNSVNKCKKSHLSYKMDDPAESSRTYSSVWADQAIGTGHARSKINSPLAWCAKFNRVGEWMNIALTEEKLVHGVYIQGRKSGTVWTKQLVTRVSFEHSSDCDIYGAVDNGHHYNTHVKPGDTYSLVKFKYPIRAKCIRIKVWGWRYHISMRAALATTRVQATVKYIIDDPPENQRFYSSVWANQRPGTGHARSMMDSALAWCARHNTVGQWMAIKLDRANYVNGVYLQGRKSGTPWSKQLVTKVRFEYSHDHSCASYYNVDGGAAYATGLVAGDVKKFVRFAMPVKAKCIKIVVLGWKYHISMRAALSTTSRRDLSAGIQSGIVTFDFTMHLRHTTGSRCIWCQESLRTGAPTIKLVNGKLAFTLQGNAPSSVTFFTIFQPKTDYKIAIAYQRKHKLVDLYVDGQLLETQLYSRALNAGVGRAHIGCAVAGGGSKLDGILENFHFTTLPPSNALGSRCTRFSCPAGYSRRENHFNIFCPGTLCKSTDRDLCCVPAARCNTYKCGAGMQLVANAASVTCDRKVCSGMSADRTCCRPRGSCSTYRCPKGYKLRPKSNTLLCSGLVCDHGMSVAHKDTSLCCQPYATCRSYQCPANHVHKDANLGRSCASDPCTSADTNLCCGKRGKCSSYKCPHNYKLKLNAADIWCTDSDCKDTDYRTCCAEEGHCSTFACPAGYVNDKEFYAADGWCAGLTCTASDKSRCCTKRATCSSYACPAGYQHKAATSFALEDPPEAQRKYSSVYNHDAVGTGHARSKLDSAQAWSARSNHVGEWMSIQLDEEKQVEGVYLQARKSGTLWSRELVTKVSFQHSFDCHTWWDVDEAKQYSTGLVVGDNKVLIRFNKPVHAKCIKIKVHAWSWHIAMRAGLSTSGVKVCKSWQCTSADQDTCCAPEGRCDTMHCPSTYMLKSNANALACHDPSCKETDYHTCCAKMGTCATFTCPGGYIQRPHKEHISCYNATGCSQELDKDRCCVAQARCNALICPSNQVLKVNAPLLFCKGSACTLKDDAALCCEKPAMCTTFVCPVGYKHLPHADQIPCGDQLCSNTKIQHCCAEQGRCSSYSCPAGFIARPNVANVHCEGFKCGPRDRDTCCDPVGRCSELTCPANWIHKKHAGLLHCIGKVCLESEYRTCCDQLGTCPTYNCPTAYDHRLDRKWCQDKACNHTDFTQCCAEKGTCATAACPSTHTHRADAVHIVCDNSVCTSLDVPKCCDAKAHCDSYICPEGRYRKPDAASILCAGTNCTSVDDASCCAVGGTCATVTCPAGWLHKPNPELLRCSSPSCDTKDYAFCCSPEQTCATHTCPPGKIARPFAKNLFCGPKCDAATWDDTCCQKTAHCGEYICPGDQTLKNKPEDIGCAGLVCNDADAGTCCGKRGSCSLYACPAGTLPKGNSSVLLCEDGICADSPDNTALCCGSANLCYSYQCPVGFTHRANALNSPCIGFECSMDDLAHCCIHTSTCATFQCPAGKVLRPDPDFLHCSGPECSIIDTDTCCASAGHCDQYSCPYGFLPRKNASMVLCHDHNCSSTPYDVCCVERPSCSEAQCPKGTVHSSNMDELRCFGYECTQADEEECCNNLASCETMTCPLGHVRRHNASEFHCAFAECKESDEDTCCIPASNCTMMVCPSNYGYKPDYESLYCHDPDCHDTSYEVCCEEKPRCTSFMCPSGHVPRDDQAHTYCFGHNCSTPENLDRCCDKLATCETYECPGGFKPKLQSKDDHCKWSVCTDYDLHTCCYSDGTCAAKTCNATTVHRHNAHEIPCKGDMCADTPDDVCCVPVGVCSSLHCPAGTAHKHNADDISCMDRECTADDEETCCEPSATCDTFNCGTGFQLRYFAPYMYCESNPCAESEKNRCCAQQGKCSSFACPAGYTFKHNSHEINCPSPDCNSDAETVDTCCAKEGTCDTLACPPTHTSKPSASSLKCRSGSFCTEADWSECCERRASCASFTCPSDLFVMRPNASDRLCAGEVCGDDDVVECCTVRASCASLKCDNTTVHKTCGNFNNETCRCTGHECQESDQGLCCEARQTCADFECPLSMYRVSGAHCAGPWCDNNDLSTCCKDRAFCKTFECPSTMHSCTGANCTFCAADPCDAKVDTTTCCIEGLSPVSDANKTAIRLQGVNAMTTQSPDLASAPPRDSGAYSSATYHLLCLAVVVLAARLSQVAM